MGIRALFTVDRDLHVNTKGTYDTSIRNLNQQGDSLCKNAVTLRLLDLPRGNSDHVEAKKPQE